MRAPPLFFLCFGLIPKITRYIFWQRNNTVNLIALCIVYLLVLKLSGIPLEDSIPAYKIHKGDLEKQQMKTLTTLIRCRLAPTLRVDLNT